MDGKEDVMPVKLGRWPFRITLAWTILIMLMAATGFRTGVIVFMLIPEIAMYLCFKLPVWRGHRKATDPFTINVEPVLAFVYVWALAFIAYGILVFIDSDSVFALCVLGAAVIFYGTRILKRARALSRPATE
jgi:hypothetical protein